MTYAEIIGYVAIIFAVISFSAESTTKMRKFGILSSSLIGLSVYLNQGIIGAVVTILGVSIKILSLFLTQEQLKPVKYSTPVIAILYFVFYNTEGFFGSMPVIALFVLIYADIQADILKMKYIYLIGLLLWLIYGIYLLSPAAIIYDIVAIIIMIYSIFKLRKDLYEKVQ